MGRELRKMGYCSWLVSCRLFWLNLRARWGREKCLAQRLGIAMYLVKSVAVVIGIKKIYQFAAASAAVAWWLRQRACTAKALVRSHKGAKCFLLLATKLAFVS